MTGEDPDSRESKARSKGCRSCTRSRTGFGKKGFSCSVFGNDEKVCTLREYTSRACSTKESPREKKDCKKEENKKPAVGILLRTSFFAEQNTTKEMAHNGRKREGGWAGPWKGPQ